MHNSAVKVWEEKISIPTYLTSEPDKNPLFLEKRVYQGSSGKVYPHPVTEKNYDEKTDVEYQAVYLENDYLKVMILPELGGRIQRAYDKTNDYDFVYYNSVIKPALVGLTGPWISGGIEFNWPQHHRPSTFMPTEYTVEVGSDGSQTVWVSEIDKMYGTKGSAGFTLHPDKSYIEITGKVYNRTDIPQTFLWWANPAVPANDHTYSVFPPDVNAVMDHGKRAVSTFLIATGTYYKYDYSAGIDISKYKNVEVPTSYMAHHSDYDFIGNYDEQLEAGLLHVADHHVSPGKKQWTWGHGDFGQAWDRNLTDEDGPYIELMTGVFTDNQPDFTWLKPYEEKTFKQYFMPYKGVGRIKNATIDAACNLELLDGKMTIKLYTTKIQKQAILKLRHEGNELLNLTVDLSPESFFNYELPTEMSQLPVGMTLSLTSEAGEQLVEYIVPKKELKAIPDPEEALDKPEKLKSTEELFLAAMHIEQHRHATLSAEDYYLEGLRRDPSDIRLNNGYGMHLYRQGKVAESQKYFETAVAKQKWKSPNPSYGEPLFNLGLSLKAQGENKAAYDAFYKATWNDDTQSQAWYQLATLESQQGNLKKALDFIEKALVKNQHHMKARVLQVALSRHLNQPVANYIQENLQIDQLDLGTLYEKSLENQDSNQWLKAMRQEVNNYLELAVDYLDYGLLKEALNILEAAPESPLVGYYQAYIYQFLGDEISVQQSINKGEASASDYCFPNKLFDQRVLEFVIQTNPTAGYAKYYLGNLLYDKQQFTRAIALWEEASVDLPEFATVLRNLAFATYNKQDDVAQACDYIQRAINLDPNDARLLLEQEQLASRQGVSIEKRIQSLEKTPETTAFRDDLFVEYITLLNSQGKYKEAYQRIMGRKFHPWEGGEGKISGQFEYALIEMAKACLTENPKQAIAYLEESLVYPENLGEGKLPSVNDNLTYYYLGKAYEQLGEAEKAQTYFEKGTFGLSEPGSVLYYNDQPADTILYQGWCHEALGNHNAAKKCYHQLLSYGEKHLFDDVSYDYFAVSLPNTAMYKEDLQLNNEIYCQYLIALSQLGLGNPKKAETIFNDILEKNPNHQDTLRHLALIK